MGAEEQFDSREADLMIACASGLWRAPRIRELVHRPEFNWDGFFAAASENYIEPLAASRLEQAASDLLAPAILNRLRKIKYEARARALRLAGELVRITAAFDGASDGPIRAIPYKGPALAMQAYADLALRRFDDLDFILPHTDLAAAGHVLRDLSYEPLTQALSHLPETGGDHSRQPLWPIPGEYVYRHSRLGTVIELHTELTLRHFPRRVDLTEFARRLVPQPLDADAACASRQFVQTFCPEDALVFLAVHGAKDLWARLAWVADIAHLIRGYPQLDWNALLSRAERLRAGRMVLLAAALAADLLDAPVPAEVRARFQQTKAVMDFAQLFARAFRAGVPAQLATWGRFHYRRRMVRGWTAGWSYALRLTLVPAEEDWNSVRLPRVLAPVYALARPLRLMSKYRGPARRPLN